MWHTFSIRTQLLILLSSLLLIIGSATMGLAYWLDKQQRQTVSIELASTLTNALSQDMLKAVLTNQTDNYADLSFRLTQFNSVKYAMLFNQQNEPVFKVYQASDLNQNLIDSVNEQPQFDHSHLYIKLPIIADQVKFGEALYVIDINELTTQLDQQLIWLAIAIGNFNQAKAFIEEIKQQGIGLALDDFGTGMSSFEYLKILPFDIIKIDGSFVKDMQNDPTDKAVIRYIQEISALRNQETIAEYVENQQTMDELTEIGITYAQGYHLGRPIPLKDWLSPVKVNAVEE